MKSQVWYFLTYRGSAPKCTPTQSWNDFIERFYCTRSHFNSKSDCVSYHRRASNDTCQNLISGNITHWKHSCARNRVPRVSWKYITNNCHRNSSLMLIWIIPNRINSLWGFSASWGFLPNSISIPTQWEVPKIWHLLYCMTKPVRTIKKHLFGTVWKSNVHASLSIPSLGSGTVSSIKQGSVFNRRGRPREHSVTKGCNWKIPTIGKFVNNALQAGKVSILWCPQDLKQCRP